MPPTPNLSPHFPASWPDPAMFWPAPQLLESTTPRPAPPFLSNRGEAWFWNDDSDYWELLRWRDLGGPGIADYRYWLPFYMIPQVP